MSVWKKMVISFLLAVFLSLLLLFLLGNRVNPILVNYFSGEVERVTSNVVDSAINDILTKEISESLFSITRNDKNEVEMIDYNTKKVNSLLKDINQIIYSRLYDLEEGNIDEFFLSSSLSGMNYQFIDSGIVCEVPLGALTGNGFVANLGPVIPLRMSFLGQVSSHLKTKVTSYGINNLLLEVYVEVEIKEKISLPKSSDIVAIKVEAPLSIKVISGVVPNYYGGIIDKNSLETFSSMVQ